jgi:hypothetical protein
MKNQLLNKNQVRDKIENYFKMVEEKQKGDFKIIPDINVIVDCVESIMIDRTYITEEHFNYLFEKYFEE